MKAAIPALLALAACANPAPANPATSVTAPSQTDRIIHDAEHYVLLSQNGERWAEEVYLVTSGEPRALYAANNISQAFQRFASNGVRMGGLVGNLRAVDDERAAIETLATSIGSRVVGFIPKDPVVSTAERRRVPVVDSHPESPATGAFEALYAEVDATTPEDLHVPRPLPRGDFERLFLAPPDEAD